MNTVLDLLTAASQMAGIIGLTETLDADEAKPALTQLNMIIGNWNATSQFPPAMKTVEYNNSTPAPSFTIGKSSTFTPDIDAVMFPYLLAEAKATAMSLFKTGPDPKIEQVARRQKVYVQNDKHKVNRGRPHNNYGRR